MLTEFFCWALFFLLPLVVLPRTNSTGSRVAARLSQAPDLEFPAQPSSLSSFDAPRMAIFKPQGDGPFPGLVLFHQCAGLGIGRRPNQSMLNWAREAVSQGYAVLLIDSLGPRGVEHRMLLMDRRRE